MVEQIAVIPDEARCDGLRLRFYTELYLPSNAPLGTSRIWPGYQLFRRIRESDALV